MSSIERAANALRLAILTQHPDPDSSRIVIITQDRGAIVLYCDDEQIAKAIAEAIHKGAVKSRSRQADA